jgi:hypothetical protein
MIMPSRIARLPRTASGLPIPYFVDRPADGSIDFRVMHPERMVLAMRQRLCWTCGERLGRYVAFVGGPLSISQRQFSDPASHRECAEYALTVCPFLTSPTTQRRDAALPEHATMDEAQVAENPGVFGLLITRDYTFTEIVHAGRPLEIWWYTAGRRATRTEVEAAIATARQRDKVQQHPMRDHILALLDQLPLPK